ncbi:SPARC-like [Littorina saxatilis]|uniref:SPARC/Testican calcium-binding domain-containing protein n=1 Tax=Littorina saxatilis TaxID=31220 RepID=A0AAN9BSJ3_9CAEN
MKLWLLALLLLGVLLSAAMAEQHPRDRRSANHFADMEEDDDDDDDGDDEDEYAEEEVDVAQKEQQQKEIINPCTEKVCRRGELCTVDKKHRAKCICIPQCETPPPDDNRYQVCSKRNVTYQSECELDRDHCLCRRRQDGCSRPGIGKIRLDYYGPCQDLTPCSDREFKEFPGRMREWLFVVMQQMAQRAEIPDYLDLLEKARHEGNHSHAVIWKFCDLDQDPHDRFVTRRELMYTVQSLKALEHCLIPFLDQCDANADGQITLKEWGTCLGLQRDSIRDECKTIRRAAGREEK